MIAQLTAVEALLGFALWTALLAAVVFGYRSSRWLGGTAITSWARGQRTVSDPPVVRRIEDAHANCLENLPVFAVIVLAGAVLGEFQAMAGLATLVLYARLAQSLAHVAGTGPALVFVRAGCWIVQLASMIAMGGLLLLRI
ncbi:MAPEG family protein [Aquabacterium humicola]|uniref:MAPEG family protein n=1 Tax=Aquabacterium humicola TaxID=3237377 RepID=UPI002543F3DE|nr:MAPEG family protein [Rubrivivax pictus]